MEDRTRTWLSFTAWLRTQAAAEAPEADQGPASEGHTSNPEPSSPPSPSGQLAGGPQRGAAPAAPAAASAQRRQGRSLQPASCGMEDRLLEGYLHGAQQEMSLLLAAPGLPAHRAPIITAKQVCGWRGLPGAALFCARPAFWQQRWVGELKAALPLAEHVCSGQGFGPASTARMRNRPATKPQLSNPSNLPLPAGHLAAARHL